VLSVFGYYCFNSMFCSCLYGGNSAEFRTYSYTCNVVHKLNRPKTMRIIQTLLLLLMTNLTFGQKSIFGNYYSRINGTIELKSDSTFIHKYRFDLSSSWTQGNWKIKNDTIYLMTKLVMDTLQIRNTENKVIRDSLVLSSDQKIERIEQNEYLISTLSNGGQNRIKPPNKLFRKKKKLYLINENGTLDLRKLNGMRTDKKYYTYFKKFNE